MKQDKEKALFIARKMFAELVFDIQRLEGMPFTMPEVQTYLQGITVGGHKISDEEKLKQQILAWEKVIELVKCEKFTLTRETAFLLQTIIAKDEALEVIVSISSSCFIGIFAVCSLLPCIRLTIGLMYA